MDMIFLVNASGDCLRKFCDINVLADISLQQANNDLQIKLHTNRRTIWTFKECGWGHHRL
jgi:hypothetical protein